MEGSSPYLRVGARPELSSPVLICAFAGWNDAAEVATHAARELVKSWNATRFGDVDPEQFFVFTETRPMVRIDEGAQRRIEWPSNELYYRRGGEGERDCVVLVGTEPQLRWRTFVDTLLDMAGALDTKLVVTLGGLLADVPHSRPARLTGSATDPHYAERLGRLNVRSSRYEGPTGIVGVLNQACRQRGLAAVSLWGNVPHYINSAPNPKVTVALLRRLDALLDFKLDLGELEESVVRFEAQVQEAIARDPEAQAYVRRLEQQEEASGEIEPDLPESGSSAERPPWRDLPTGEEVVRELEEFLRRRNGEDEPPRS